MSTHAKPFTARAVRNIVVAVRLSPQEHKLFIQRLQKAETASDGMRRILLQTFGRAAKEKQG